MKSNHQSVSEAMLVVAMHSDAIVVAFPYGLLEIPIEATEDGFRGMLKFNRAQLDFVAVPRQPEPSSR